MNKSSQTTSSDITQQLSAAAKDKKSTKAFGGNFKNFFEKSTSSGTPKLSLSLKDVNKLFFLGCIVFAVYLGLSFAHGMQSLNDKVQIKIDSRVSAVNDSVLMSVPSLDPYLDVIRVRNIFKPFEKKTAASGPSDSRRIVSLTEKLKLRGVSWFDSAESASAMIEDSNSGLTYFLKQGEQVNGVTIKMIYADQVILSYEGEEISIKL